MTEQERLERFNVGLQQLLASIGATGLDTSWSANLNGINLSGVAPIRVALDPNWQPPQENILTLEPKMQREA